MCGEKEDPDLFAKATTAPGNGECSCISYLDTTRSQRIRVLGSVFVCKLLRMETCLGLCLSYSGKPSFRAKCVKHCGCSLHKAKRQQGPNNSLYKRVSRSNAEKNQGQAKAEEAGTKAQAEDESCRTPTREKEPMVSKQSKHRNRIPKRNDKVICVVQIPKQTTRKERGSPDSMKRKLALRQQSPLKSPALMYRS